MIFGPLLNDMGEFELSSLGGIDTLAVASWRDSEPKKRGNEDCHRLWHHMA